MGLGTGDSTHETFVSSGCGANDARRVLKRGEAWKNAVTHCGGASDVLGPSGAAPGVRGAAGCGLSAFGLLRDPLWGPASHLWDVKRFSAFWGMPGEAAHGLWEVVCLLRKNLRGWKVPRQRQIYLTRSSPSSLQSSVVCASNCRASEIT